MQCSKLFPLLDGPEGNPTMSVFPTDGQQHKGEEVSFKCDKFEPGNPKTYTYTWKKDGDKLMNVKDTNEPNTLTFEMTPEDEGNYTCLVENAYGETNESAAVELRLKLGPPTSDGMSCFTLTRNKIFNICI